MFGRSRSSSELEDLSLPVLFIRAVLLLLPVISLTDEVNIHF